MSEDIRTEERDFGKLFVRYQPRIFGYICSLVTQNCDAEDLLQETASVLWQKFDDFQPGSDFLAWALQVAHYRVLYFRQRQKRNVLQFSDSFIDVVGTDAAAKSPQLGDLEHFLVQCMQRLSATERELFLLRYQSDESVANLAERLGRPASTIYDRIHRIRRTLADCVNKALRKEARA